MQTFFWAFIAMIMTATLWRKWRIFTVAQLAQAAARTGDVTLVARGIGELAPTLRADAFDRAVTDLWRSGARPLAVRLVRSAAQHVGPAFTTQFWIREGLEHEPALAGDLFDDDFMAAVYEPPVAQACGSYG